MLPHARTSHPYLARESRNLFKERSTSFEKPATHTQQKRVTLIKKF